MATSEPTDDPHTVRGAVLYPAVAEAARRTVAATIGLIDVGSRSEFNLLIDRVGITYTSSTGVRRLGDAGSPVQLIASMVGRRDVPAVAIPTVVTRIGIDRRPLRTDLAARGSEAPTMLVGDPVALVVDAIALVPAEALAVVTTTWALSRWSVDRRRRFVDRLAEASTTRPLAWVSVEGVGVAPSIPTLGDRPASGHSIIGLRVFGAVGAAAPEALGRCWSRGRQLSWLVGG